MLSKSVQKSIRITPTVEAYINQQPGENFSDKLDRLLTEVHAGEKDRIAKLAAYDRMLADRSKELEKVNHVLTVLDRVMNRIKWVEGSVSDLVFEIERNVIQNAKPPPAARGKP